jgi:hypothetical protein
LGRGVGLDGGTSAGLVSFCVSDGGCIAAGLRLSLYSNRLWVMPSGVDPDRAVGIRVAV